MGGNGMIAFASSFPGQILARQIVPGQELIVQKTGFLASEAGVSLSVYFQKKLGAGIFGGEGFIMQRLSGSGMAFLEFEINVDPSINSVHIVKLVLQPIVENAIYHGLKYKESKGMLTVNGYQKDGNAVIEIADDGVGMDEETLNRIFEKHKVNYRSNGVGVYNVQRRLSMYYGKEYGLSYKSEKGKGTTVTVVIPIEQEEHHEKA